MKPPVLDILERLFRVADDYEASTLEELAIKAGILWRCDCGWNSREDNDHCEGCSTVRPRSPGHA